MENGLNVFRFFVVAHSSGRYWNLEFIRNIVD